MKPYAVEVQFTMIVMAKDEVHAHEVAEDWADNAWCDDAPRDFSVCEVITSDAGLARHGWDVNCFPYGGDGESNLKHILANQQPEPERDTQTIDMFGGAP